MTLRHTIHDREVLKAIKKLPPLMSTDEWERDRTAVKLFDAYGSAFWVLWEFDPESGIAFGLCDLGMGYPEIGSVLLAEIQELGPRIERDVSVSTLVEGYRSRNVPVPDYLVRPQV